MVIIATKEKERIRGRGGRYEGGAHVFHSTNVTSDHYMPSIDSMD